ncbi:YbhB/YbcL family Raf kinase inhibitor-like protein [Nocardiopsis trehalosi]|jgi:Raf kinase inhibitor-like YbhB/YbcL family protein|uniref:YbhB/YbcL family Raf kinase inhibitor-like protein n=1 Tax=Nocardiopsis trehalosi TaxID=109329 RepID=UPI0008322185|nr:YbhB/YbcL family Raf kinase inhibitor-like protein [Nocardiopsis trehalosi]
MFPVERHRSSGPLRAAAPARARSYPRPAALGGVLLLGAVAGCGPLPSGTGAEMSADINLTSTMMQEGSPLPDAYTCEGEGLSPALQWSGLPDTDRIASLAVIVDAPEDATVHWVIYGLDPLTTEIRQNTVPQPGRQGLNSAGQAAYDPPCPEEGEGQEYRFTLYALNGEVDLPEDAPLSDSLRAIADRAVARGSLTATGE